MASLVDLHSHVLPGVDDGSETIANSLEMLRRGLAEGIRIAVLTPHLHPHDDARKEEFHRQQFMQLQQAVREVKLDVWLHLGAEIGFRFNLAEAAGWPSGTLSGNGQYPLIDLPMGALSPGLEQGFFQLRTAGYKPILAHPERHRLLASDGEQLERLRDQDLLFQVNAGSLTGQFGRRARAAAEWLLERSWVDFVASDGHDLEKRPFSLVEAYQRVTELAGADEAERLFCRNPLQAIRGGPIEAAPAAVPGFAHRGEPKSRGAGVWKRLTGEME